MFSPPDYSAPDSFLKPRFGPWTTFLYFHRKPLLDAVLDAAPLLAGELLDVGCGNKPYASLLKCERHVGVDVESSPHSNNQFDKIFDGKLLPFADESFDSVLCTEVLEHAFDPLQLAAEIGRVLRPGGYALVTAPFVIQTHEIPHDYQRFTQFGMERIASIGGLEVVWLRPRGGVFVTAVVVVQLALANAIGRRPFSDIVAWGLFPLFLCARVFDRWRGRPEIITLGWQMLVKKQKLDIQIQ